MKERLWEFMKQEGLTAGKLAEIAGVQPSAVSHILSGRNKPGFDFIYNIIRRYPDLDVRWLILGEKTNLQTSEKINYEKGNSQELTMDFEPMGKFPILDSSIPQAIGNVKKPDSTSEEFIERIVIFFKGGTYKSYR